MNEAAGGVLPRGVAVDRRLVLVVEAKPAHPAMLRHVALRQLPARGPTPVQVAPNDTLARVQREAPRPPPRLRGRILREVHGRGAVLARTVRRLAAVLRLQAQVRTLERLAEARGELSPLLMRIWLRRRQRREGAPSARALRRGQFFPQNLPFLFQVDALENRDLLPKRLQVLLVPAVAPAHPACGNVAFPRLPGLPADLLELGTRGASDCLLYTSDAADE